VEKSRGAGRGAGEAADIDDDRPDVLVVADALLPVAPAPGPATLTRAGMVVCHEDAEEGAVGVLDPSASISHTTRVVSTLSRPATLCYERSNVTVIYTAKYTEYWKQNSKRFKAGDFIAELPQHIP
jgi:hypothetical protein